MYRSLLVAVILISPTFANKVPDESVIPQWRETFAKLLAAKDSLFRPKLGPELNDADLLRGAAIPQLIGADTCKTEVGNLDDGVTFGGYRCTFDLTGESIEFSENQYLTLVHLVEKVVGSQVDPETVYASSDRTSHYSLLKEKKGYENVKVGVGHDWSSTRTAVSLQVTAVSSSTSTRRYSPMPPAQRLGSSGSGPASVKIKNDTAYTLSLIYEGTSNQTVSVPPRATQTIQLPAGSYRVTGRVAAPNVLPFMGSESFGPGDRFAVNFYIQ